jgi:competence protein ComEC
LGRSAAFLIDTGPPEADVAAQILRLGVDRLDAAIISHAHLDHAGGLREVRRRLTVGTVYAPEAEARLLLNAGLGPVRVISRGDLLRVDEVSLDVLWPPHGRRSRDRNDSGAVIAAEIDRFRVLFPADLEAPGLRGLLQVGRPAPVSLLLAPHHGSANAAWDALLRAVQPRFVAVSARAGFPSPAVLGLAERCGAEVRATFSEGTLVYPAAR